MIHVIPVITSLALAPVAQTNVAPTPVDHLVRGALVTVEGVVARITDEDEFRLTDATGTVRVYVGPNWVPAGMGEAVRIEGDVDDDIGPLRISAHSLMRADGTVVSFDRHDR